MNFCPDCENSLNTKISSDDNTNKIMSFVCNNCSYKKVIDISKEPEYKCVFKQNLGYEVPSTFLCVHHLCTDRITT